MNMNINTCTLTSFLFLLASVCAANFSMWPETISAGTLFGVSLLNHAKLMGPEYAHNIHLIDKTLSHTIGAIYLYASLMSFICTQHIAFFISFSSGVITIVIYFSRSFKRNCLSHSFVHIGTFAGWMFYIAGVQLTRSPAHMTHYNDLSCFAITYLEIRIKPVEHW